MAGEPQELWPGEARHRLHPDDAGETGMVAGEFGRLRVRPAVVVQDRRPDRTIGAVDQHRPVHLARKPDRLHGGDGLGRGVAKVGYRARHRGAPDVGVLLGPARPRAVREVGARRARDRRAAVVDEQRLEPRRAAVEPEKHGRTMPHCWRARNPGDRADGDSAPAGQAQAQPRSCRRHRTDAGGASAHRGGVLGLDLGSRSRMWRRPDKIGMSAPRVASSRPSQSPSPA